MQEFLTLLLQTDGQSFLINVSVEVSSFELIKLCRERLASFTSTLGLFLLLKCIDFVSKLSFCSIEPEKRGAYTDPRLEMAQRTNYAL